MLQALSPGYLRVGGPESDSLFVKRQNNSTAFLLTETQWMNMNQLAADTGLHLIFTLSPKSPQQPQKELLMFSDIKGYPITWQLGYRELINNQTYVSLEESIQEVSSLRRLIDSFPRYQNTAVLSPDLELCEDAKCLEAFKNFIQEKSDDFDFFILQMSPQESIQSMRNMFEKLEKKFKEIEKLALERGDLTKPNMISTKQQFWLVDAEGTGHHEKMAEAMSCAMYLGLSSQLGYHTSLLHLSQLSQPSSRYWVALLYRALVGREILGTKMWPQSSDVAVFAACTETKPNAAFSTEWLYTAPAVTLWGINSANESSRVFVRASWRVTSVHLYVLTCGDNGSILLNGQLLRMVHGVLPRFKPHVRTLTRSRSMSVTVPPQSVFFIVLPETQAPACLLNTGERRLQLLKKENINPLVHNIPIAQTEPYFTSWQNGIKPNVYIEKGGIFDSFNEEENLFLNHKKIGDESNMKKDSITSRIAKQLLEPKQGLSNIKEGYENKALDFKVDHSNGDGQLNIPLAIYNKDLFESNLEGTNSDEELTKHNLFTPSTAYNNLELYNKVINNKFDFSIEDLAKQNEPNHHTNDRGVKDDSALFSIKKMSSTNHDFKANVPRVKRSQDYGKNSEIDSETSPLYRRVNMLRRILHKLQQKTLNKEGNEKRNLWDTSSSTKATTNYIEDRWKARTTYNDPFPPEIYSSQSINPLNDKGKTSEENNKVENINYLPGEFYEILGGMKIDSNVSLKDIEDTIDTSKSLKTNSEPQICSNESKLSVSKKPENNPQEDRKIVESATENAKKYYGLKNNSVEPKKIEKIEDQERNMVKNKQIEITQMLSGEHIPFRTNDQIKPYKEEFYQDLQKEENNDSYKEVKLSAERTKRETKNANKLQKHIKELEGSDIRSDYPDEVELQQFLEELTNEGEQLMQTIDEDYESNIGHFTHTAGLNLIATTELPSILYKDEKVFSNNELGEGNKTEESDHYLKNNIVIDKDVKPKITYPSFQEDDYLLEKSTTSITNMEKTNLVSATSTTIVPFVPQNTPLTKLVFSKSSNKSILKTNIPDKSITEGINNSDMYIDGIALNADKPPILVIDKTPKRTIVSNGVNLTNNNVTELKSGNVSSQKEFSKSDLELKIDFFPNNFRSEGLQKEKEISKDKVVFIGDTKTLHPVSTTEKYIFEDKVGFIGSRNIHNITDGLVLNETNYNVSELKNKVHIDNSKDEITYLHNSQPTSVKKTESVGNTDILVMNTNKVNSFDSRKKINSESKLENKVLPPLKSVLSSRPLPVIPTLTLKRNSTLSKKINDITNKISSLNNPSKSSVPTLGISSLSNLEKSRQERLETIKQRLQKAKERLMNLTSARTTQSPLPNMPLKQKREIISNIEVMTNSLLNEKKKTKSDDLTHKDFIDNNQKVSLDNFHLIHRLRRQAYDSEEMERNLSVENNFDHSGKIEDEGDLNPKKQPPVNIITPYYFPQIKKWIIPLSNKTENIVYNTKMFPVNVYGIVSEEWAQKNVGINSKTKRRRRAVSYPCVKDNFNDFEDYETVQLPQGSKVENKKILSDQSNIAQFSSGTDKPMLSVVLKNVYPTKSKRAINQDIELNKMEMKALLTNEIVKEKPTDEIDNENIFNSMLQKTVNKTLTNKTGIDKMLELAKQYQETNPTSLEIFSQKNKRNRNKKYFNELSDENTATEIIDDNTPKDNQIHSRLEYFDKNYIETDSKPKTSGFKKNNKNNTAGQSSDGFVGDEKTTNNDDPWSIFINTIEDFFESATSLIKKGIM